MMPASIIMMSSPYSMAVMFLPTSPTPPRKIIFTCFSFLARVRFAAGSFLARSRSAFTFSAGFSSRFAERLAAFFAGSSFVYRRIFGRIVGRIAQIHEVRKPSFALHRRAARGLAYAADAQLSCRFPSFRTQKISPYCRLKPRGLAYVAVRGGNDRNVLRARTVNKVCAKNSPVTTAAAVTPVTAYGG